MADRLDRPSRSRYDRAMPEPCILLVDDEQEILEALCRTLRGNGYRFFEATSATEALDVLERQPVDLLVSDIDMPETSGLDLMARVKNAYPHVGRIILTGVASLGSALRAINDGGVQRFLTKPWGTEELRTAVRESLARGDVLRGSASEDPPAPTGDAMPEDEAADEQRQTLAEHVQSLSPRLRDTLRELLTGAGEKEIALRLGLSPHTAHQYVKTLYRRFHVASRAQLMATLHSFRGGLDFDPAQGANGPQWAARGGRHGHRA
jgi:DNA-binding NarL/FixJ family response regulator